jgi:N-acetylneuraminic acid mutarotase
MWRIRRFALIFAASLLSACGGGGGDNGQQTTPAGTVPATPAATPAAPVKVNGAVQKGPFIVGSTVLINRLDKSGQATSQTILSEIKDSIGSFDFVSDAPGPVQIVATGYYFSELTGQISSGTLTLRALYELTDKAAQRAYVNLLTHLINHRALKLLSGGTLTMTEAIAQAESELLKAFNPALPVTGVKGFSELNIYGTESNVAPSLGSAYLLALSTAFYKYAEIEAERNGTALDAELSFVLNRLSDDLADNGAIDQPEFMNDFIRAVRSLSPATILDNLQKRSLVDYPRGLSVPDISVFLNLCAGTLDCPWRGTAPIPLLAFMPAIAEFDGKIYMFGGAVRFNSGTTAATYEYDPVTNEWTARAPMPVASFDSSAHVIGDKIYVLATYGVNGFLNDLLEYTPATNTWRRLSPRPTYRYEFVSAAVNGKIYVLGGTGQIDDGPWSGKDWSVKDHVEIYDVATDSWSTGQPAPMPFSELNGGCVHDGVIYIFGELTDPPLNTSDASVLTYDTAKNSWSATSALTFNRKGASCVTVGDQIYVAGGMVGANTIDVLERFDPLRQTWSSPTRLPTPRWRPRSAAVGDEIFFMSGSKDGTWDAADLVDVLNTGQL